MRIILSLLLLFNYYILSPNFKKADDSKEKPILNLFATSEIFSFQIGGKTTSIKIPSNTCWEISSNSLWCKSSVKSGKGDIILGEYGVVRRSSFIGRTLIDHLASRNYYLEYVTKTAVQNAIVPFYWDNGYSKNNILALFSRSNGAIIDHEVLKAIMNGGNVKKYEDQLS
jgi:hypothetical protein